MAAFRLLNEFGSSSVVFALEPANRCACRCTYCFAELNNRAQLAGRSRSEADPGTFESTAMRAMGSGYDPTDFRQWAIRNRMTLGFANTVEPFQDLPQAKGILDICSRFGLPLFVQTKGHNFAEVADRLEAMADRVVLFASFPTDDDRAIKRFEVGCPKAADRYAMIERAAAAGIEVVLALAPYHEDWCADPAAHVRRALEAGAKHVFYDRLHLNDRQEQTATDKVMVDLAKRRPDAKTLAHRAAIYSEALAAGADFYANGYTGIALGKPNTTSTFCPLGSGLRWGYQARSLTHDLEWMSLPDPDAEEPDAPMAPLVVTWEQALAAMEAAGDRVDQPFSYSSMRDLLVIKKLPVAWQRTLEPAAPVASYLRAIWNSPSRRNIFWRHPFAGLAIKPDGQLWRGDGGDAVMVFDPDSWSPCRRRVVEDLDELDRYVAVPGA